MDLLSLSDKKPANSPTICHSDSKLGEFDHISSVESHSSELLHLIADVSNNVSFDNVSNSISSSSGHEICNCLNFYFNENDAALDFDSIMDVSNSNTSIASYQLNQHWDMNMFVMDENHEMSKLFPFQNKNGFSRNEGDVYEINKQFPCQNYADSTILYESSQYKSLYQDIDIFLNMDELGKQSLIQNMSGMVWDDGMDVTRFYLPIGTEVADENGIEIEIGRCWEDIEFSPEELPDLMEIDSVLERHRKNRITLVLDLDETLVRTEQERCYDVNFFIMYDNIPLYVKERPYLRYFLEKVAGMFEIVIFTAGVREYASKVLDKLDPEGKFFSRRFYRDSCTHFMEGGYVKDLNILGVDLAKAAIIDNLPKVYRFQKENGIPIKSWYGNQSDVELVQLLPFLETLAEAADVRPLICKTFNVRGKSKET